MLNQLSPVSVCVFRGGGGGGEYSILWYFRVYVGSELFWGVQNFEFQYFFFFLGGGGGGEGGSENEYFWGYYEIVDIFGVVKKLDCFCFILFWGGGEGVIFIHFKAFS